MLLKKNTDQTKVIPLYGVKNPLHWHLEGVWKSGCKECNLYPKRITIASKFLTINDYLRYRPTIEEFMMNYLEAMNKARSGAAVRRTTWHEDESLWSNGRFLLHTTPYFKEQEMDPNHEGYPYVVEDQDVVATDWVVYG